MRSPSFPAIARRSYTLPFRETNQNDGIIEEKADQYRFRPNVQFKAKAFNLASTFADKTQLRTKLLTIASLTPWNFHHLVLLPPLNLASKLSMIKPFKARKQFCALNTQCSI